MFSKIIQVPIWVSFPTQTIDRSKNLKSCGHQALDLVWHFLCFYVRKLLPSAFSGHLRDCTIWHFEVCSKARQRHTKYKTLKSWPLNIVIVSHLNLQRHLKLTMNGDRKLNFTMTVCFIVHSLKNIFIHEFFKLIEKWIKVHLNKKKSVYSLSTNACSLVRKFKSIFSNYCFTVQCSLDLCWKFK